jgi:hypothetical protein
MCPVIHTITMFPGQSVLLRFTAPLGQTVTSWTTEARFATSRAADGSIEALVGDVFAGSVESVANRTLTVSLTAAETLDLASRSMDEMDFWRTDSGSEYPMARCHISWGSVVLE